MNSTNSNSAQNSAINSDNTHSSSLTHIPAKRPGQGAKTAYVPGAPAVLKVSSKSSPASVAGAIAGMIKDGAHVEVQSVGAGAVNQAVKAIAISRGFLSPVGIEIACVPYFADIVINEEARTAIRFKVEPMEPVQNSDALAQNCE